MKKVLVVLLLPLILAGCGLFKSTETVISDTQTTEKDVSGGIATIKGKNVSYGISYNKDKWSVMNGTAADEFEYEFSHKDGDLYALIIPERLAVPMDSLKALALDNLKAVATDASITFEELRTVNGVELTAMKMEGVIEGIEALYYGYFYSGDVGTIQFIAYTSKNLFSGYESDMVELLNGLEFYEPGVSVSEEEDALEGEEVVIEGGNVSYSISYDSSKWAVMDSEPGSDSEYDFEHIDGDVYGMVIPERIEIPLDSLKEIALQNALLVASDAEINFEEMRTVNGVEVLAMKIKGTIEGIPFQYYGYYYAGDAGSIQFITFTGQSLFDLYEDEMRELLDGLMISE